MVKDTINYKLQKIAGKPGHGSTMRKNKKLRMVDAAVVRCISELPSILGKLPERFPLKLFATGCYFTPKRHNKDLRNQ